MSLEQLSSLLGTTGAVAGLIGLQTKVKEALNKQTKKEENKERLADALHILDDLQAHIRKLTENGNAITELVRKSKDVPTQNDAEQLYSKMADIFDNVQVIYSSFRELTREANTISKFEFLERVKQSDPVSYEIIAFLAKCYRNGKIDVRDLPILISLYGTRPKETKKITKETNKRLKEYEPLLTKAERISTKLPRPVVRTTKAKLRRSIVSLAKENEYIEKLDESVVDQLMSQSPEWMSSLNALVKETWADFEGMMEQRRFRLHGKKEGPPPPRTNIGPPG